MDKIGIEFSYMSMAENISQCSTSISNHFLYSNLTNKFCQGGLLDDKLGCHQKTLCKICKKSIKECTGHFGCIKLYLPVFNIGYLKSVQILLQIICKSCSRILVRSKKIKTNILTASKKIRSTKQYNFIKHIIKIVQNIKTNTNCVYCNSKNGVVRKLGNFNFVHDMTFWQNSENKKKKPNLIILNPLKTFRIFQKMGINDLNLIGMEQINSRPENLILTYITVPPLTIRPSISLTENITNEDDLTLKLSDIQYFNLQIKQILLTGIDIRTLIENWNMLQIEISRYMNSEIFLTETNNKIHKGLYQRLKGKKGRFRGNLGGKRVDFCARTVISPDPNLCLNYVGIPLQIALKLTLPEKVNKLNFERLQRSVYRGCYKYPGANFILNSEGNKICIQERSVFLKKITIKENFRIERHIKDNDTILFNRQPSLHRVSIMSHRVKIVPNKTFKLNSCSCKPYNADFDGDEMNVHVPQTQKARSESMVLMNLALNTITPRNGELQISPTQDLLSLSFSMTSKNQFFSLEMFSNFYVSKNKQNFPVPSIIKPLQLWTGKQVFFSILCINSNSNDTKEKNKFDQPSINVFQNTEKIYSLDKKQCSPFVCPHDGWVVFKKKELISGRIGKQSIGSNNLFSFLYTLANLHSFCSMINSISKYSYIALKSISEYGFSIGIDDVVPNHKLSEKKKNIIRHSYGLCQFIKRISIKKNSHYKIHKILSAVRDALGKSFLETHFFKNNFSINMVTSGSKGSMVNLAQMISCVGQQSIKNNYIDYSTFSRILTSSKYNYLKFTPEDDGFIVHSFQEGLNSKNFFLHTMAGREGLIDTAIKTAQTGYIQRRLIKFLEDIICSYDFSTRTADGRLIRFKLGETNFEPMKNIWFFSLNCTQIINFDKISPIAFLSLNFFEIDSLAKAFDFVDTENILYFNNFRNFFFTFYTKHFIIYNTYFTKVELIFRKISRIFLSCLTDPGSPVGAEAGQSIGEPSTQLTLQTFHSAGISDTNITLGTCRINEILNASKTINFPTTKIQLTTSIKKHILGIKRLLKGFSLKNICEIIKITLKTNKIKCDIKLNLNEFLVVSKLIELNEIKKKIKDFQIKSKFVIKKIKNKLKIFFYNSCFTYKFTPFKLMELINFCKNHLIDLPINKSFRFDKRLVSQHKKNPEIILKGSDLVNLPNFSFINQKTIYSNHIFDTVKMLGIEAARSVIIMELEIIFEAYGIKINKKHLSLLSDLMTFQGEVLGITRYGLSKIKSNTLVLASFEKTVENLFTSAMTISKDQVCGVSENIILGKEIPVGTGLVSLRYEQ
nr:RNA polymerase III largest subunit [Cryptomonas paramecium]